MNRRGSTASEPWRWFSRPWRSPSLLASLIAAFAAPAVMTSSADLFAVSASDSITAQLVDDAGSSIDTVITTQGRFDPESLASLEAGFEDRLAQVARLGAPTLTLFTDTLGVGEPPSTPDVPIEVVPGSGGRFFVRDGAIDALEVVDADGDPADGVWVSERHAEKLSLEVGDEIGVEGSSGSVIVAGIHRDLWRDGRDAYWDDVPAELVPRFSRIFGAPLFELFIVSRGTADALGLSGVARIDVPVPRPPDTLSGLEQLVSGLRSVERDFTRDDATRGVLERFSGIGAAVPSLASGVFDVRREALRRSAELDEPIAATSVAGIVLGLGVSVGGAGFLARRRRRELRLLRADGDASWRFVARAIGEFVVPGSIATGIGILVGWTVIRLAGPTRSASLADVRLSAALLGGAAGVVCAAVATAVIARRTLDDHRPASRHTLFRWLLPTVVLAAAAWIEVGSPDGGSDIDVLVVAFPIVGLAAGVGVAVVSAHQVMAWLRRAGAGAPPALFLAWRRIVAAEVGALALAVVVGTAFGSVLLPALLVDSLDEAARAKATVVVGGPTRLQLVDRLDDVPAGSTTIRTETTRLSVASERVRIQAIDPASYAQGVSWSRWFGSSADELVELLDDAVGAVGDDVIPVVVVGERDVPATGAFGTDTVFDYATVGSLDAAPLAVPTAPTIILSADRFDEVAFDRHLSRRPVDISVATWAEQYVSPLSAYRRTLVTDIALPDLEAELRADDVRFRDTATLSGQLDTLDNQAVRWSFSYFRILAATASVAAAVGLLLYLGEQQSRRELGDALTRRMGLRRGVRLWSLLMEVSGLVFVSFAAGVVVAVAVAHRIFARFEPAPSALPSTDLRVAWPAVLWSISIGAAAVFVVVLVINVRSERHGLGEILRGS